MPCAFEMLFVEEKGRFRPDTVLRWSEDMAVQWRNGRKLLLHKHRYQLSHNQKHRCLNLNHQPDLPQMRNAAVAPHPGLRVREPLATKP